MGVASHDHLAHTPRDRDPAFYGNDCSARPWLAALSLRRFSAALRTGQACRNRLDFHARDKEGTGAAAAHKGPAAIRSGNRIARRSGDARARLVDGDDVHAGDGNHSLRGWSAHWSFCRAGRVAHPAALREDRASQLHSFANDRLLRSWRGATGRELSASPITDRCWVWSDIWRRVWKWAPAVRLPSLRI